MSKGGKRPGAGAPRGNLNRVTHGRRSKLITALVEDMLKDPRRRRELQELSRQGTAFLEPIARQDTLC